MPPIAPGERSAGDQGRSDHHNTRIQDNGSHRNGGAVDRRRQTVQARIDERFDDLRCARCNAETLDRVRGGVTVKRAPGLSMTQTLGSDDVSTLCVR
jgi:hypothetical protein